MRWTHRCNQQRRRELELAGQVQGPSTWGLAIASNGDLHWDNVSLYELAQQHGTPLQVISAARLASNFHRFREAFRKAYPNVEVGFSYKTNPLPAALDVLRRAGAVAETISTFELWLASRLGNAPEQIVFNGPAKTRDGLKIAVERGVRTINFDNADEADMVAELAKQADRRPTVGVRVVTSVGWAGQFGLPISDGSAFAAFERIRRHERLQPRSLHIHLGTGIRDLGVYVRAVDELFAFAKLLKSRLDIDIDFFDLGGGFAAATVAPLTDMDQLLLNSGRPSRPVDPAETPSWSAYAEAIADSARRAFGPPTAASPTLFFEPGRALSSDAQLLLLTVLAIKAGPRGSWNVILDGGHNVALPTAYEHHAVFPVRGANRPNDAICHFFGPLCHPADIVGQCRTFPIPAVGDVIAVMDAGAYFIPNQMNFSNPRAGAVILEGGTSRVARAAESFEHMVALDAVVEHE